MAVTCWAVMTDVLELRRLTRDRPALGVMQAGLSDERLAVTVRLGNEALAAAIDGAQVRLAESGKLAELGRRWLGAATGSTAVLG